MGMPEVKNAFETCKKAGFPLWALCIIVIFAGGIGFYLAQGWTSLKEKPSAPVIHIHPTPAAPGNHPVSGRPGAAPVAPAPRPPASPVIPVDPSKEAEQLRQITQLTRENQAKDRDLEAVRLALAQARTGQEQRDALLRQRDKELDITKHALDQLREERRRNDALVRERDENHKQELAKVRKHLEKVQAKVTRLQEENGSLQGRIQAAQRQRAAQRVPARRRQVAPVENVRIGYKPYSELSPAEKKLYAGLP